MGVIPKTFWFGLAIWVVGISILIESTSLLTGVGVGLFVCGFQLSISKKGE